MVPHLRGRFGCASPDRSNDLGASGVDSGDSGRFPGVLRRGPGELLAFLNEVAVITGVWISVLMVEQKEVTK